MAHPVCDESDVRALDAAAALAELGAARRAADLAEADVLALAVHLVDLFPVTPESPAASWHADTELVEQDVPCPVAGDGTPEVAERAVVEIGAALGVSYRSALCLVADAVELCFRLPTLVGPGAGGPVAGVEGAAGRTGDQPSLGRGGGVRGPAGRDRGSPQPAPGRACPGWSRRR